MVGTCALAQRGILASSEFLSPRQRSESRRYLMSRAKERLARYSLTGPEAQRTVETGLADGAWFRSDVPRKRMKELMRRSDYPAIRDTVISLVVTVTSGVLGCLFWGSWPAIPCFLVYGIFYASASDARWHECGHGTAFKTRWLDT